MAFRDGPFENLKVPLIWTAGITVLIVLVASAFLLISQRRGDSQNAIRGAGDQVSGGVGGVLAAPVRWVGAASDYVGDYFFAVSENRRLKEQVAELQAVADANIALQNINTRYEAMLGIRVEPSVEMETARSISESRGPFARSRLVDVGTSRGVRIGNPVINEHGLVGRVVGTSPRVSRVLLVTDVSSRIPVLIDRTDARAMLSGDGSGNPRLEYVRGTDSVEVGDRVLTSGDGGGIPRGVPIGVVARGIDGSWRVKLFSDRGAIDFVKVMKFEDFGQLVDPEALNAPPLAALGPAPATQAPATPPPATPAQPGGAGE
ncbi:rod shape-determining protein MreC [Brevundimonas sp.]|uniref:rod shape-determining protein MreC n=1 Tax=Brevundimonas sp. TaxID=1871086 RepID=UPI001D4496BA|nr:rod shape-determining protein MreC [Brevundimonas sp.]MBL0947277.1 rod shape-determining protein MreC [Brevundimonas sp.]